MSRRPAWLRRRPVDWDRPARQEALPAPGPVDVVVPVYGAFGLVERCLASLARHTDLARHALLLSLDGPGQEPADDLARRLLPAGGWRCLRAERRGGFVAAANRGLRASSRDVVLLNSDTEVTAGWLERLQAAAMSGPAVASATPFCNDATLCSLPRPFVANRLPRGFDVDALGRLVESASAREYPRLPTGVGVCLYLRRRALDVVGLLDEQAFGLGYGEENDWCFRALRAGFVHVLDDATFVFHAGGGSFGPARAALQRRAARALAWRHPGYHATVAAFMRADPLAATRARVLAGLAPPPRPAARPPGRVLHVVHGWPPEARGGTELYAHGLAHAQAAWREVLVHARLSDPRRPDGEPLEWQDGAVRVRWQVNDFRQRDPLARNALANRAATRDILRLADEAGPGLVHVHHLAGHAAGLLPALRRRGLPLVVQLQDWWPACARTNLVDRGGAACPGPGLARCARCFDLTRLPPAPVANRLLHLLRRRLLRRALACADAFVAGSPAVAHDLSTLLPAGVPVHALDYGGALPAPLPRAPRAAGAPLRFGFVGTLMPHKGPQVALEAWRGVDPARATLELWGAEGGAPGFAARLRASAGPGVSFRGAFDEERKAEVFAGLDVLVVPSLGRESFGLVCREAASAGVPVLASRQSALAERLAEGCGQGFAPGDAGELRGWVGRLLEQPLLLDEWRRRLPAARPAAAHAQEIEAVYASVLERRSRSSP